uniref:DNA 3'-5' helicase n=1 Tax=Schistosoma mansoni TaxID=6183 RepID=A0A5K4F0T9_SCHMA
MSSSFLERFASVFDFNTFNNIQNLICREIFKTNKSLVVSAPTGSGKTVIFELAIVKQLNEYATSSQKDPFIIIYIAPTKSICSQTFSEWNRKFSRFSISCLTSTGDSEFVDIQNLDSQVLLITTPEKLNSTVKTFRDLTNIWNKLKLCFIDEVHLIGEHDRGSILEALITRTKMLARPRFICASASLSNVQDIAQWLSVTEGSVTFFSFGEEFRTSPLRKVVHGYIKQKNQSIFQFEVNLNYRLPHLISTYSSNKPVLIFCTTRSGAVRTATYILKHIHLTDNSEAAIRRRCYAQNTRNIHLKDFLSNGIAYHHAGMDVEDRKLVEDAFRSGCISVLTCTSTLAMGVNLPAHLVIVKNTEQVVDGELIGYSSTQLSQMIGRAGRPQFDNEGVAVIMTTANLKAHYTKLLSECDEINSCLESHLTELLLCEIVLRTVFDFDSALNWIKNTFFYVRITRFPHFYGLPENCDKAYIDHFIQDLCIKEIKNLQNLKLVDYNSETSQINPTDLSEIIFKNNLQLDTFMKMSKLSGEESVEELLYFIANCSEMNDIRLRHCEKSLLNKISRAKGRSSLRFPIHSRVKNASLKVVCLLQAQLGQVAINDYSLKQESEKILQSALRILNGLTGLLWLYDCPLTMYSKSHKQNSDCSTIPAVAMKYPSILSALELRKSIHFRRWLNYPLINLYGSSLLTEMQIEKLIGANLITCSAIQQTESGKLENILNERPPYGRKLLEYLDSIPKYELEVEQKSGYDSTNIQLMFTITQKNNCKDCAVLLVGSAKKYLVRKWLLEYDNSEGTSVITRQMELPNDETLNPLNISLISVNYGGVDLHTKYHFISLSNKYDRLTSTPNISTEDFIQKEISIGYTELITQQCQSPTRNIDSTNGNDKLNLWPEPTSSFINNINRSNDNNNDTFLNLKLPLTPIVNKTKQSSRQNLKLQKCTMNIQSLRNQTETHYKTPYKFRWTPTNSTNEQQSPKTPLIQTSMLDYMRSKCKDSRLILPTYKQTTKVKDNSILESPNNDEPSIQKISRKRFKWDPEDKITIDTDLNQSSTFTLTPVLDGCSYTKETPAMPYLLLKDNTPDLFSIQSSFINNDFLCESCPPICDGSSKYGYLSGNSLNLESIQNQNLSLYSNINQETESRSHCPMKSDCLNNNYNINQIGDEESVKHENDQISTPQYRCNCTIFTPKANLNEHNTVSSNDLSKSNFPLKPYTVDIVNFTPRREENPTTVMTEIESDFDNTGNSTLEILEVNEKSFIKPKDFTVSKSVQNNQSRKMNECTPQLQKKITWSKDITINNEIRKKQKNQWKNENDQLLYESEKSFSVDYQLINDGWCELACLIKFSELGLLHEQIKPNSISTGTETPQPSCSKRQLEYEKDKEEKHMYNANIPNSVPTTLALKRTGIGMLDLSLTPDSYIKEE